MVYERVRPRHAKRYSLRVHKLDLQTAQARRSELLSDTIPFDIVDCVQAKGATAPLLAFDPKLDSDIAQRERDVEEELEQEATVVAIVICRRIGRCFRSVRGY